ncbi:MAG TPA: rod shape-determining protein RodA, partial [Longimicrobiales bacterium]|nr:rod shape-determining protein RodA [Longimicrobiales bacterium]
RRPMKGLLDRWLRDPPLFAVAFLLSAFGVAMIYSAGVLNVPSSVTEGAWIRQIVWFGLALGAFAVVSRVPLRWIEWAALPSYVVSIVLLAATLVVGTGRGTSQGVKSWLTVGGFSFQPAELAKIATVLALARLLSTWEGPPQNLRDLLAPSALVALPLGLVILQPDLGTALAFLGIFFAVLHWAGTPFAFHVLLASPALGLILSFNTMLWSVYIVALAGFLYVWRYRLYLVESVAVVLANLAAGTVAQPLWRSLADYQRNRLLVFLDPGVDPRGAGWHLIQSKVAIGSGGLTGKGFTLGTQKRLDFLPEQHTDFIFSVVGEELGFVGTSLAILALAYVLIRLIRLAERSADPFAGLVIFGIFGAWIVHIFVNIGMTAGLVPVTGIPLPFVSYGGSFLLMSWIAVATAARLAHEDS